MADSLFNEQQWNWIAERFREGYSMTDLAYFLGVHRITVRRQLTRLGAIPVCREELPPLSERRKEFLSLDWREIPLWMQNTVSNGPQN